MQFISSMTFSILIAIMVIGCDASEVDTGAETDALRVRSEALAADESARDFEAFLSFWAEDAIVQPSRAPQIEGKEAIGELSRPSFSQVKEFTGTSSHIEVSAAGDLAYEYGINRVVLPGPEGDLLDMGKYLLIWKKINGEWYITALSFTSDASAPVPLEGR